MIEVRPFADGDLDGVRATMEASYALGEMPGMTRAFLERTLDRIPIDPVGTLVARLDGQVVGHCTPRGDDLTVHPDWRRRGVGTALVGPAVDLVRDRGLPFLQLHVPRHLPGSEPFARSVGLHPHSSLWQLDLPADRAVEPPRFPSSVAVRGLAADEDLDAYVALLNATFIDHPTPMSWTVHQIREVHALPGFDPTGILLVTPADRPNQLVAFTRADVEPDDDGVPTGWVELIGVIPAWRGLGLGRELLRWGIAFGRSRGAGLVQLAVEARNERALGLYRRTGFEPSIEWPHWIHET
jgi:mycothiol synthase